MQSFSVTSAVSHRENARILVVDDEASISRLLARWLCDEGYECGVAFSAEQALDLMLQNGEYELLITDIVMPGLSGLDLLQLVHEQYPDMAVIMATGLDRRETAVQALHLGAFGYIIKPVEQNEFLINVLNALERRRLTLESKAYEERLRQEVRERTAEIRGREEEIALRLVSASEFRDEETGTHIKRIGAFSAALAEAVGWDVLETDTLKVAALMHDVGKIGIPDRILLKPGQLEPEEFEIIKSHTEIGARILGCSNIRLLQLAADIAFSHHEKWDGSGYPRGLAGEAIPLAARIVAVADVYDALSYDRVYRPAFPEEKVLAIMAEGRESHFDPVVYDNFLDLLPAFRRIRQTFDQETALKALPPPPSC